MAKNLMDLKGYLLTNVMLIQVSDGRDWETQNGKGVTFNLGFTDKKEVYLVTCSDAELVSKLVFGNMYHIALDIKLNTYGDRAKQSIKLIDFVEVNPSAK